jgi:hypothetical protein
VPEVLDGLLVMVALAKVLGVVVCVGAAFEQRLNVVDLNCNLYPAFSLAVFA